MSTDFHSRSSYRLKYHSYAEANAYHITICTSGRQLLFSRIENAQVILTPVGKIIDEEIRKIPIVREDVEVDTYVVMPNHVHLLLILHGSSVVPLTREFHAPASGTISSIINSFKGSCTVRVRRELGQSKMIIWQSRFYDRLVRDEDELNRTRIYIINNPAVWEDDPENPERRGIAIRRIPSYPNCN